MGAVGWARGASDAHLGHYYEWRPGWQWGRLEHPPPRHQLTLSEPARKTRLAASKARGLSPADQQQDGLEANGALPALWRH